MNRINPIKQVKTLLFLSGMIFLFAQTACSQTNNTQAVTQQVEQWVNKGAYQSAFEWLDSLDPGNQSPDLVLLKMDIALKGHTSTVMHQMFGFENLKQGEKPADKRNIEGSFKMKTFIINEVLDSLIQKYPKRYDLQNALLEFYYEIHKNYPEGWVIKKDEIIRKALAAGAIADKQQTASAISYYYLAYLYSEREERENAIVFYQKALQKDPYWGPAYYNLALELAAEQKYAQALENAHKAVEFAATDAAASDANRLAGYLQMEQSNDRDAYASFKKAWNLDSNNLENAHAMTLISVQLKRSDYVYYTEKYFMLRPDAEEVYMGLVTIYAQEQKIPELARFFERMMPLYKNKTKVMAHLSYATAGLIHTTDKKKAILYLKDAEKYFKTFLPSDHALLFAIQDKLEDLSK